MVTASIAYAMVTLSEIVNPCTVVGLAKGLITRYYMLIRPQALISQMCLLTMLQLEFSLTFC